MIHNTFQDHPPLILEKKTLKFFTIYGHIGHNGHVTWMVRTYFFFSSAAGGSV